MVKKTFDTKMVDLFLPCPSCLAKNDIPPIETYTTIIDGSVVNPKTKDSTVVVP